MPDKITGYLEVGTNHKNEVVLVIPSTDGKDRSNWHADGAVLFGPNDDKSGIAFDDPDDAAFIASIANFSHVIFSPDQARSLAALLIKKAAEASGEIKNS